jgi:hypothetical protein
MLPGVGMLLKRKLTFLITIFTTCILMWFVLTPAEVVFSFKTNDGKSDLSYSCISSEGSAITKANAEEANRTFQTELKLISDDTASRMQDEMTHMNASGQVLDLAAIEREALKRRLDLVNEIRDEFGCTVTQLM